MIKEEELPQLRDDVKKSTIEQHGEAAYQELYDEKKKYLMLLKGEEKEYNSDFRKVVLEEQYNTTDHLPVEIRVQDLGVTFDVLEEICPELKKV